ncbi:glycosyltransferase family A protein [Flavobacterium sp.]|uniref:glycosyltransferase family A protein n=1 Tax=Flavobacterium sp. TaxID=239 RepID=UPI0039199DB9
MRIGKNPQIAKSLQTPDYFHQVIVPVYIPNNEDYFKDSFNVFKITVDSLLKTCHAQTFISIVNNGSSAEVEAYLEKLYENGDIHELIQTNNIGKVNAVNKALVGQSFPLVTITDADVLFLNDWQKSVYEVLEAFPKAGAVCTTPNSRTLKKLTENIYFDNFFSKSLRFTQVKDSQAMIDFVESIGNPWVYRPIHLEQYLTVNHDNISAVVGAGHYVCTYRRDALPQNGFDNTDTLLGKNTMDPIDLGIIKKGFWRLSTVHNFTYHMGNQSEDWMYDKLHNLVDDKQVIPKPKLVPITSSPFLNWFKIKVFGSILFSRHIFWKNFLRFKGLKKEEAKHY